MVLIQQNKRDQKDREQKTLATAKIVLEKSNGK